MQLLDRTTHAIGAHQDLRKVFEVVLRSLEDNLGIDFVLHLHSTRPTRSCSPSAAWANAARRSAQEIGVVEQAQIEVDENGLQRCVRGELVYEPDIEQVPTSRSRTARAAAACARWWPRR